MAVAHILTDSSASLAAPATLSVTKPTGGTPGSTDRLILVVGSGAGSAVGSYTAPSGWTSVGSILNTGGSHINFVSLQVWHAAGDVVNLDFTKSGTIADVGWVMVCFSGVDTSTPIDATGTANTSSSATTLTTNAVTIATDQSWHLIGVTDWLGGTYSATSFTVVTSPTTNQHAGLLYNTTPKSTGSTGTVVVTAGSTTTDQVINGVPFALRPAAGGAATTPPITPAGDVEGLFPIWEACNLL